MSNLERIIMEFINNHRENQQSEEDILETFWESLYDSTDPESHELLEAYWQDRPVAKEAEELLLKKLREKT